MQRMNFNPMVRLYNGIKFENRAMSAIDTSYASDNIFQDTSLGTLTYDSSENGLYVVLNHDDGNSNSYPEWMRILTDIELELLVYLMLEIYGQGIDVSYIEDSSTLDIFYRGNPLGGTALLRLNSLNSTFPGIEGGKVVIDNGVPESEKVKATEIGSTHTLYAYPDASYIIEDWLKVGDSSFEPVYTYPDSSIAINVTMDSSYAEYKVKYKEQP